MPEQASGAAPAVPPNPIASIKAFLSSQQAPAPDPQEADTDASARPPKVAPVVDSKALPEKEAPEAEEAATREDADLEADEPDDEPTEDDAQDVEVQLESLKDLAEATELDLEKILDLTLPTKIDGKESTARIRDLLKSYQLDGHINTKLQALDNDRKVFETKRTEYEKAATDKLTQMDQGIAVLERALVGEYESVDWKKLQAENPAEFNAYYVGYQQRFGQMQQLAQQIQAEKQKEVAAQQAKAKAWSDEQRTLLKAKIPEWGDDTKRAQDRAAIESYLKGHGITKEEFATLEDHRFALVIRDAWKYGELQKGKPATLKKVKAAPKLLKPGTKQSRESRESLAAKDERSKLARSGRVRDATSVLKRTIFGTPR